MNLRLSGNSIRIRITKDEFEKLRSVGSLSDTTEFPGGGRLQYRVEVSSVVQAQVGFESNRIRVGIPKKSDFSSSKFEFRDEIPLEEGRKLKVVVEVDAFTL